MTFTWNQRIYRAISRYVGSDLIDEERVQVLRRALYFGQFKWTLHFSPQVTNWSDYEELHQDVVGLMAGFDHRLVSSRQALYFNLYGSDPQMLNVLRINMGERLEFSSIRVVSSDTWHLVHPRAKNKGLFHHKYAYRIKVRTPDTMNPATLQGMMTGDCLVSKAFFYCTNVRDVILFKLLHSQDIIDITERSVV